MIVMRPLREFRFPVTADCVTPDIFENKTCKEIEELQVWEGNKQKTLGDLFKIEESDSEKANITIYGDVSKVRRMGACMKQGEISIQGNVGAHVGEEMRGGKITVYGNVGGWAGSKPGLHRGYHRERGHCYGWKAMLQGKERAPDDGQYRRNRLYGCICYWDLCCCGYGLCSDIRGWSGVL